MDSLHPDLARVLIPADAIQSRVEAIAAQIERDLAGDEDLYLVGILKGAFIFLADLARRIRRPHVVDFMALSSYGRGGATSDAVRILMDLREPVRGRHVLIVEDIVDSGRTLDYLRHTLLSRRPASLRTCVLLRKPRAEAAAIDYLGFDIPDVWVVGYGLDYAEAYRTLPFVAELKPEVYRPAEV